MPQLCKKEQKCFENDLLLFSDFQRCWEEEGLFTELHPVFILVRTQAYHLCHKFNRNDDRDDLTQIGLIFLSQAKYKGLSRLSSYIYRILRNELGEMWKKDGRGKMDELTEDKFEAHATVEEVFQKLNSDQVMRRLLAANSELIREIIRTTLYFFDNEKRFSKEKVINALTEKNYKRYEIIVAFDRLRDQLRKVLR